MNQAEERSLNMLATALEIEEKGKKYYEKAAATCRNQVGREVFEMLAGYEVQHMDRIREIHDSLKSGEAWSEKLAFFTVVSDLGGVFRDMTAKQKEHIRADTDDVEALGVGIEFESASVKFYEDQLELATEPVEKKFIELMAAEERVHLQLLADMRLYYTDPESWLLEKERAGLDGA